MGGTLFSSDPGPKGGSNLKALWRSHLTSARRPISYRIRFMARRSFFVFLFFSTNEGADPGINIRVILRGIFKCSNAWGNAEVFQPSLLFRWCGPPDHLTHSLRLASGGTARGIVRYNSGAQCNTSRGVNGRKKREDSSAWSIHLGDTASQSL